MEIRLETQFIAAAFKMCPKKDSRLALTGVHVCSAEDGRAMIVGCDACGLILFHSSYAAPETDFTIPPEICKQIKYKKNGPKYIDITIQDDFLSVKYGMAEFHDKVMSEKYPRVRSIIENYTGNLELASNFSASVLIKFTEVAKILGLAGFSDDENVHYHNNGDKIAKVVFTEDVIHGDSVLDNVIGYIMPKNCYDRHGNYITFDTKQF